MTPDLKRICLSLLTAALLALLPVSGKCGGENHMWNIARLDGKWLWFDATADRGLAPRFEPRHFALEELEERYSWDSSQIDGLIAADGKG